MPLVSSGLLWTENAICSNLVAVRSLSFANYHTCPLPSPYQLALGGVTAVDHQFGEASA